MQEHMHAYMCTLPTYNSHYKIIKSRLNTIIMGSSDALPLDNPSFFFHPLCESIVKCQVMIQNYQVEQLKLQILSWALEASNRMHIVMPHNERVLNHQFWLHNNNLYSEHTTILSS